MNMVTWFLVVSFWLPSGDLKIIGGGGFATEPECMQMLKADLKAKSDLQGLKGECRSSAPKPSGLPEAQPHVPSKVDA